MIRRCACGRRLPHRAFGQGRQREVCDDCRRAKKAENLRRWRQNHPEAAARDREASRLAKHRRKQPCIRGCGRLTAYDRPDSVCVECAPPEQVWTKEAIIEAMLYFATKYGRQPGARDWNPGQARRDFRDDIAEQFYEDACWPAASVVQLRFGSWNAAIAAAGFTPLRPGHKHSDRHYPTPAS